MDWRGELKKNTSFSFLERYKSGIATIVKIKKAVLKAAFLGLFFKVSISGCKKIAFGQLDYFFVIATKNSFRA